MSKSKKKKETNIHIPRYIAIPEGRREINLKGVKTSRWSRGKYDFDIRGRGWGVKPHIHITTPQQQGLISQLRTKDSSNLMGFFFSKRKHLNYENWKGILFIIKRGTCNSWIGTHFRFLQLLGGRLHAHFASWRHRSRFLSYQEVREIQSTSWYQWRYLWFNSIRHSHPYIFPFNDPLLGIKLTPPPPPTTLISYRIRLSSITHPMHFAHETDHARNRKPILFIKNINMYE